MLDFSLGSIIPSIIFGVLGIAVIKRGKQNLNFRLLLTGIAMVSYTFFTSGALQAWAGGLALCGAAYWFWW